MQVFRVALLQMTAGSSQEENQRKGLDWCRRAKAMGADLALFPEMWNTGYAMTEDEQALRQNAVGRDSGFVRRVPGGGEGAGHGGGDHLS